MPAILRISTSCFSAQNKDRHCWRGECPGSPQQRWDSIGRSTSFSGKCTDELPRSRVPASDASFTHRRRVWRTAWSSLGRLSRREVPKWKPASSPRHRLSNATRRQAVPRDARAHRWPLPTEDWFVQSTSSTRAQGWGQTQDHPSPARRASFRASSRLRAVRRLIPRSPYTRETSSVCPIRWLGFEADRCWRRGGHHQTPDEHPRSRHPCERA